MTPTVTDSHPEPCILIWGPGPPLRAQDSYLGLRTPTWDLVPSLGAQDPPLGPLLGSQEFYLGPGNLTQGLGPPFMAQDPYSGCKTNTHSAAPQHRAHDLFGSQVPNSRLGTFVLSELKAYIGSLGAIASPSNPTKQQHWSMLAAETRSTIDAEVSLQLLGN